MIPSLVAHELIGVGHIPDTAGGIYNPALAENRDDGTLEILYRAERDRGFTPESLWWGAETLTPAALAEIGRLPQVRPVRCVGWDLSTVRLEDPRLSTWDDGRVWVTHTTVTYGDRGIVLRIRPGLSAYDRSTTTLTRLADPLMLPIVTQRIEKNWVLLPTPIPRLVYSLDPLIILRATDLDGRTWVLDRHQPTQWQTALGQPPRLSTPLIRFHDGWLGWWHIVLDRTYVHGAFWLDQGLTLRYRTAPLLSGADPRLCDSVTVAKPGVCYLSGQWWDHETDQWFGTYGDGDTHARVMQCDGQAIARALLSAAGSGQEGAR